MQRDKMPIKLSIRGTSWTGWTFGPFGRSNQWRLHAPDGTHYTAGEIAEIRPADLNLDFLQVRVRELELELTESRKAAAFYKRQVIFEAMLGLALHPALPDQHRKPERHTSMYGRAHPCAHRDKGGLQGVAGAGSAKHAQTSGERDKRPCITTRDTKV